MCGVYSYMWVSDVLCPCSLNLERFKFLKKFVSLDLVFLNKKVELPEFK